MRAQRSCLRALRSSVLLQLEKLFESNRRRVTLVGELQVPRETTLGLRNQSCDNAQACPLAFVFT